MVVTARIVSRGCRPGKPLGWSSVGTPPDCKEKGRPGIRSVPCVASCPGPRPGSCHIWRVRDDGLLQQFVHVLGLGVGAEDLVSKRRHSAPELLPVGVRQQMDRPAHLGPLLLPRAGHLFTPFADQRRHLSAGFGDCLLEVGRRDQGGHGSRSFHQKSPRAGSTRPGGPRSRGPPVKHRVSSQNRHNGRRGARVRCVQQPARDSDRVRQPLARG